MKLPYRLLYIIRVVTVLEYFKHILAHFWRGSACAFSKLEGGALAQPSVTTGTGTHIDNV